MLVGVVLLIAAVRDKQNELGQLLIGDVVGSNSFLPWAGAIAIVYFVSKIDPTGRLGKSLMLLVVLSLMLSSGSGFFDKFVSQVNEIKGKIQ